MPINSPVKAEKKDDPIEIIKSEPTTKIGEEIEIDATTGKPVETTVSVPSISPDEIKKMQARIEYQARQNEKMMREMQETMQRFNKPVPAEKPVVSEDFDQDLDAIARTNYQKAIKIQAERVAESKFNSLMEEREKKQAEQFKTESRARQLEMSKARVLKDYPSLSDETSDEYKVYLATFNQLYNEDPDLKTNSRAPEIVMYEMEKRMKAAQTPEQKENERLRRVAGGAAPQGKAVSTQKTIKLTQSELDMCKSKGISPATYAQMKEANFKEGVTA